MEITGHGGELALAALRRFGVEELFTLSGGHIFPLYDAAVSSGVRLIDMRHEQTATFAAEAMAKLTRRPGVVALTAGPGVTNGVSATTTAWFNGSPLVVIGGRAGNRGWGRGALQEFDHVPVMASITKLATTIGETNAIADVMHTAAETAATAHRGPVFVDIPIDVIYDRATVTLPDRAPPRRPDADVDAVARAAALIATAHRPAIIAGSDVYFDSAWGALRAAAESLRVPVFMNGLGRGCLAADHELAFSSSRSMLKREADVVVVIGTPLDFRVGFGSFGDAQVLHVVDHPDRIATHVSPAVSVAGDLAVILQAFADHRGPREDHDAWIAHLRDVERTLDAHDKLLLGADSDPIKPTRVYGELRKVLDRDAVVVCDGGDFVSYAGKYIDSYEPGCWLDPGPYGCLGTGMGYAMAARIARPDRQVVVMMGDGAAGFSLLDVDSLVRHGLAVVVIVGNNGCWALEKFPMTKLYGYHVAAELRPETRYDRVVEALGGAGETITEARQLAPALARALASGVPYLLNVITDPDDEYPRQSALG
ncbi:MAG TPA: acetolactate synthase [Acidimicrobiales bacterium]|nr:acetolactate synthase [Acidimicrobiales bacterium]